LLNNLTLGYKSSVTTANLTIQFDARIDGPMRPEEAPRTLHG